MSSLARKVLMEAASSHPSSTYKEKSEMPSVTLEKDYSPLPWSEFFDRKDDIRIGNDTFRAYFCGSSGPVLFLLHGAGHSALSWAMFAVEVTKRVQCQVFSIDLRGHGNSFTEDDGNLSAEVFVSDIGRIFAAVYGDQSPSPEVILVGHSMGGAIAVKAAAANAIPALVGLAVIDVVEGTAIDSLTGAQRLLRNRPNKFTSLNHAIEWSIKSKHLRNLRSARVSMPGQLKRVVAKDFEVTDADKPVFASDTACMEERETFPDQATAPKETENLYEGEKKHFTWRINLSLTESYWRGWFQDLSSIFLAHPIAKLLIVAGVDRLDKKLTIGHMQGKFQLSVMPMSGHTVHEDVPDKVADAIVGFLKRYKLA